MYMLQVLVLLTTGSAAVVLRYLIGGGSTALVLWTTYLHVFIWIASNSNIYLAILAVVGLFLLHSLVSSESSGSPKAIRPLPSTFLTPGPLKPLIFPCRTTHTRLFPKVHRFGYSYLQVGIPIGWSSNNPVLGPLQVGALRPWFSISAADYLARGQEQLGLEGKLEAYLASEGESIKNYAHAYLLTAPRFMGYAFNPVSFWYLYSKNLSLDAMILEVNNTFGERRMYFMRRGEVLDTEESNETVFKHSMAKDFHVSPFNSRKGEYSVTVTNPFSTISPLTSSKIDNTIVLKSSKSHTKIVAKVFSNGPTFDPTQISTAEFLALLLRWFWVGFVTFPRICKEAAVLFWKHKLHIWFRPEVHKTSIGRAATPRENTIASAFLGFLRAQVEHSSSISSLEYTPPNGSHLDTVILTSKSHSKANSYTEETPDAQRIQLRILTPQFYADIATASSPAEYVLSSQSQPLESRTFITTSSSLLASLLQGSEDLHTSAAAHQAYSPSIREQVITWRAPKTSAGNSTARVLDHWVARNLPSKQARREYEQAVTALILLPGGIGGGLATFDALLDLGRGLAEMAFIWQVTSVIIQMLTKCTGMA